jgi:polyphosphate kinase 2 (PPK2 family)
MLVPTIRRGRVVIQASDEDRPLRDRDHPYGWTEDDVAEFFRSVPEFGRMPACSGIVLVKYWLSNRDDEQYLRFQMRIQDPMKRWRLSPMDLQSRVRWQQYAHAKEAMLDATNIPEVLWWAAKAVDKKKAPLNCIHLLLSQIPFVEVPREPIVIRQTQSAKTTK